MEKFGSRKFDKYALYRSQRREKSRLVCQDCQTEPRCDKCKRAYDLKYWSNAGRKNYNSSKRTSLVCKAFQAMGYHPENELIK